MCLKGKKKTVRLPVQPLSVLPNGEKGHIHVREAQTRKLFEERRSIFSLLNLKDQEQ